MEKGLVLYLQKQRPSHEMGFRECFNRMARKKSRIICCSLYKIVSPENGLSRPKKFSFLFYVIFYWKHLILFVDLSRIFLLVVKLFQQGLASCWQAGQLLKHA